MSAAEQAADDVEEHSPLLPRDQPVEDEEESWGGPPDASPSRRLTFLERLLLAALLLLLCLSAIFIGLFAGERASHKDVPTVTQPGTTVTHTETVRPQPTKPPNNVRVVVFVPFK